MIKSITSAANSTFKRAVGLLQRKRREREGLFLAEGLRLSEMALSSGWPIGQCFLTEAAYARERIKALALRLAGEGVPVYCLPTALFARLSETGTPQGIVLVMRRRCFSLSRLQPRGGITVVLDRVQDPGNAGTILRLADAVAADGVIFMDGTADAFSGKVIRAAMGSTFNVPLVEKVTADELFAWTAEHDLPLFATAPLGGVAYYEANLAQSAAIAFGNEGAGISAELLAGGQRLNIPIPGKAESLNVATAAAVVLYETLRQRAMKGGKNF